MNRPHARTSAAPRWGVAALMLVGSLAWIESSSAAASCSQELLATRKSNTIAAESRWRSSYSEADHADFVTKRRRLVNYATRCELELGGDLPLLLAGVVNIPFVDTKPNPDGPVIMAGDIDLSITRIPASITGPAGNTLTYNFLVENSGVDPADSPDSNPLTVSVYDNIFSSQSPTPPLTLNVTGDPGKNDNCFVAQALPGAEGAIFCELDENLTTTVPSTFWAISVSVSASDAANLQDFAEADGRYFEKNNSNNRVQGNIIVTASSGLSLVSSGTTSVAAGGPVTYTNTVTNNGPSVAQTTTIKDFVPAEVNITNISFTGGGSCSNTPGTQTITCNAGDMARNSVRTLTVTGTVKANTPEGTVLFNDVSVSSKTEDPNAGDNVDTVATTVSAGTSGLTVTETAPPTANAGTQINLNAHIVNVGLDSANNVTLKQFAPSQLEIISMTPTQGACNLNGVGGPSCNLGTLAPSPAGTADVAVVAKVKTNTPDATILFNSFQVSSDAFESNTGDNLATAQTTVTAVTSGLDVDVTAPASAIGGSPVAYTVTVANVGPDSATNVVVKDVVPSSITVTGFTTSLGACGITSNSVSCSIGTLASGASANITVNGTVKASVADGTIVLNTVSASGSVFESDTGDNAATASTTVTGQADVSIDATDSVDPVNIQTPFRWVNTISNAGPSDAVGVKVVTTIPHLVEELSVRDLPPQCDRFEETINCDFGTLKVGESIVMNIELEAMANGGTSISQTSTVSATTADANPGNNTDTEDTTVHAADLTATVDVTSSGCDATQGLCQVKGTLHVTNAGNAKSPQAAVRFVQSDNTTLGAGDPQLRKFTVDQIKAGLSQDVSFNIVMPINKYLIAQVDSDGTVTESNEDNNVVYKGPYKQ